MHVQVLVWGSREMATAILDNYYNPRVLEHAELPAEPFQPHLVQHVNHNIGVVCSCLLYMSNILLVNEELCASKQPIMQLPDGYGTDIHIERRAVERFSIEIYPALHESAYEDFFLIIDMHVGDSYSGSLEGHLDACLRVLSPEHCFAWHILSYEGGFKSFKQILVVKSPDRMTVDKNGIQKSSVQACDTSHQWVSRIEDVIVIDDGEVHLRSDAIGKTGEDNALMLATNEPVVRVYWPGEITPDIFREFSHSFVNDMKPYAAEVVYTSDQQFFTFFDKVLELEY